MSIPNQLDIAKPFLLNNYLVDPEKGLITAPLNSIQSSTSSMSIEPKVMKVLLLLVENQGELVSQEVIFNTVWPNSIFNPGSIQRCIALLRKIFGDDGKAQQIIKTHPKRGYSLQANLCQKDQEIIKTKHGNNGNSNKKNSQVMVISFIFILAIVMINLWLNPSQKESFQQVVLQALSYSKADEYFPKFSNDLLYTAYIKESENTYQVWLRDNNNERHYQLYQSKHPILSLAWLSDNQSLLFVELEYINDKAHFIIKRTQQITSTIKTTTLHQIEGFIYLDNIFIAEDHLLYAMVKKANSHRNFILQLDLVTGKQKELTPLPANINLSNIALSHDGKHLALITQNDQQQTQLFNYDIATSTLTYRITLNSTNNQLSWHPDNKTLLLNDGQHLRLLNADNYYTKVNYTSFSQIRDASFAGRSQITFTLVKYDTDIVSYSLNQNSIIASETSLVNTTQIDNNARLSPTGKALAFISKRNGKLQLYLRKSGIEKAITPSSTIIKKISAPLWQNEKALFIAVDGKLLQISVETNQQKSFTFNGYILHLLSWHPNNHSLLLAYRKNNQFWIGRYYPEQQQLIPVYQIPPEQAAHAIADNQIVVIHNSKLFLVNADGQLDLLYDTQTDNIEMSINSTSGMYYQTRKDTIQQLWHYDLKQKKATTIMEVPKNQLLLDISQDEKTVLFRKTEQKMDIVLIKSVNN